MTIVNDETKIKRRQGGVVEGTAARQVANRNIDVVDHAMSTTQSRLTSEFSGRPPTHWNVHFIVHGPLQRVVRRREFIN